MPSDKVLNLQIISYVNKLKQIQGYVNKNVILNHSKMLSWVEGKGRVWTPGKETVPNSQPPPSACGIVMSTRMCHLQEHHPAGMSQLKTGRNCCFPLQLRG